MNKSRSTIYP